MSTLCFNWPLSTVEDDVEAPIFMQEDSAASFVNEFFRRVDPAVEEVRRKKLERLSQQQRRILRLHCFEELSLTEIALQMDLSRDEVQAAWLSMREELSSAFSRSETSDEWILGGHQGEVYQI